MSQALPPKSSTPHHSPGFSLPVRRCSSLSHLTPPRSVTFCVTTPHALPLAGLPTAGSFQQTQRPSFPGTVCTSLSMLGNSEDGTRSTPQNHIKSQSSAGKREWCDVMAECYRCLHSTRHSQCVTISCSHPRDAGEDSRVQRFRQKQGQGGQGSPTPAQCWAPPLCTVLGCPPFSAGLPCIPPTHCLAKESEGAGDKRTWGH